MEIFAYARVSTDEQANSGLGLADQKAQIAAEAERRGWTELEYISDEGFTAASLDRPGLIAILSVIKAGDVLVVAKLDRLSRSLLDFAALMQRARRGRWEILALDIGVDTTTAAGEMVASVMATFAQFERRLISERTSAALKQARARGTRLGRPRQLPGPTVQRIAAEREAGSSLRTIAAGLTSDHVPTAHPGSTWHASTVRAVLRSLELDAESEAARAA